jgi:hypothetical protein
LGIQAQLLALVASGLGQRLIRLSN